MSHNIYVDIRCVYKLWQLPFFYKSVYLGNCSYSFCKTWGHWLRWTGIKIVLNWTDQTIILWLLLCYLSIKKGLSHIVKTKLKRGGYLLKPRCGKNLEGVLVAGGNISWHCQGTLEQCTEIPKNHIGPATNCWLIWGLACRCSHMQQHLSQKVLPSLKIKGIPQTTPSHQSPCYVTSDTM